MAIAEAVESRVEESTDRTPWTETTRLMSAAAYLESTFAQEVVDELVEEPYRAVQVPEGVDAVTVIRHCLSARHRKNVRDGLLAGLLLLAVVSFATRTSVLVGVSVLAAWAVVLWDVWTSSRSLVLRRLSVGAFRPDDAPPVASPEAVLRVADLEDRADGNVTVYSGFNPFTGSGFDHGGWSFAMDMQKGREYLGERHDPQRFELSELYETVTSALQGLRIEGLEIEDRLFVNGTDLRDDRLLLPNIVGHPVSAVSEADLERFIAHPTHRVRHYTCVRVVDWRGELVVSLFLRFGLDNGRLFAELSRFLLPPLKSQYRRVDSIEQELTVRGALSMIGRASVLTIPLWLRSPASIVRPLRRARRRSAELRHVKRDPMFDYGAPTTALDRARSTEYSRYFQKLDREMYVKVLERTILDTLTDFLERHDIDTSELSERRETIINNGIMLPGGSVQAHNVAVGAGAKIVSRFFPGGSGGMPPTTGATGAQAMPRGA